MSQPSPETISCEVNCPVRCVQKDEIAAVLNELHTQDPRLDNDPTASSDTRAMRLFRGCAAFRDFITIVMEVNDAPTPEPIAISGNL